MGFFTRTTPRTNASSLAERMARRTVLVLDVRQPSDWRRGHIRGSKNLPLMQLKSRLAAVPREKTIVTVCASGHRSAVAACALQRAGYQVENLNGGMRAWSKAGLPIERGPRSR